MTVRILAPGTRLDDRRIDRMTVYRQEYKDRHSYRRKCRCVRKKKLKNEGREVSTIEADR